jgi:hypothetical protein
VGWIAFKILAAFLAKLIVSGVIGLAMTAFHDEKSPK